MKRIVYVLLLSAVLLWSFEFPRRTPTATNPGVYSSITAVEYNSSEGLYIEDYRGFDESKVAKRSYKHDRLFDYSSWDVNKLFPDRQRELAYQYYQDIPGVVWIERTFFVDETEIANIHWQEFLQSAGGDAPSPNFPNLPAEYYTHPRFRYFPVTGITRQQATEFCQWRTAVVTRRYNQKKGYRATDPAYTVLRFRLPTQAEWEKCAGYGLDIERYPYGFVTTQLPIKFSASAAGYLSELSADQLSPTQMAANLNRFNQLAKQDYLINCQRDTNTFLNLRTPFQVWSNPYNQFGIYNLLGNVAEMVQEEGVVKGGSWLDPIQECTIKSRQFSSTAAENIGFRCVCELEWPNKTDR